LYVHKSILKEYKVSKKRMGRPLKTGKPLTKRVEVRMSEAEYRKLAEKAKAAGLSVSEFLRRKGD
jgi:predicted HicB family RNase H-like nuclease